MSNNAQGFWGITSLKDYIVKINGVSTNYKASDYPQIDTNYVIVQDDKNVDVLVLQSTTPTTLTMASSGVDYPVIGEPIEYIGGHPVERPK